MECDGDVMAMFRENVIRKVLYDLIAWKKRPAEGGALPETCSCQAGVSSGGGLAITSLIDSSS